MKWFESVNAFCKRMEWKDVALDELCCCAFGIVIGLCVPAKKRVPVFLGASAVAAAACAPLVAKLAAAAGESQQADPEEEGIPF